jgi:hypothetical protein
MDAQPTLWLCPLGPAAEPASGPRSEGDEVGSSGSSGLRAVSRSARKARLALRRCTSQRDAHARHDDVRLPDRPRSGRQADWYAWLVSSTCTVGVQPGASPGAVCRIPPPPCAEYANGWYFPSGPREDGLTSPAQQPGAPVAGRDRVVAGQLGKGDPTEQTSVYSCVRSSFTPGLPNRPGRIATLTSADGRRPALIVVPRPAAEAVRCWRPRWRRVTLGGMTLIVGVSLPSLGRWWLR